MSSPNSVRQRIANRKSRSRNRKLMLATGLIIAILVVVAVFAVFGLGQNGGSNNQVETKVLLQTSWYDSSGNIQYGNITIQLRNDKPITTGNFRNLVQQGKYDGTIFHRIIAGFMIQGGQLTETVANISDEIGSNNHNVNGTIAMAKTSDPNSATSSFFINVADNSNSNFDSTYTVFGSVIDGMDTVMKISNVATSENPAVSGEMSVPVQTVTLIKAEMLP